MNEVGARESKAKKNPEKRELRYLPHKENRVYIPTKEIWSANGWLSPSGIFWGCGDDHEDCARFVLARNHFFGSGDRPARTQLYELGYIQISDATVLMGRNAISENQQTKLNHADIKVPIYLNNSEFTFWFQPIINSLERDNSNQTIQLLLKQFIENDYYLWSENDNRSLHTLFDFLVSYSFTYLGDKKTSFYATDHYFFALLPDSYFVLQLWDHHHVDRNLRGLFSESKLTIIPLDDVIDYLGYDPYNPYLDSEDREQTHQDETLAQNPPMVKTSRVKGLRARLRMNDFLE